MTRKKLLIFPCNGNGIEALDCVDDAEVEFIGFIDDDASKAAHYPQYKIHNRSVLASYPEAYVLAVPGSPTSYPDRGKFIASLDIEEDRFISLVHPSAHLGRAVTIGRNCLIMAGVVLTSNVHIGNHVCILPNTVVHHDSSVGDFTLIGCNVAVAGGVSLGANCYIGSGSNIMNGVSIGSQSLIGMGSNVTRNIPEKSKAYGNPARVH